MSPQENDSKMKRITGGLANVTCRHQRCADLQAKQMDTVGSQSKPTRKIMKNIDNSSLGNYTEMCAYYLNKKLLKEKMSLCAQSLQFKHTQRRTARNGKL